jgi:hypothetical protein
MFNKKTLVLIVTIVALAVVYFVFNNKNVSTLNNNEKAFDFKSTDKIDKIFITNKFSKEYVTLSKVNAKEWLINNEHIGNISQIEILLETLRKVRVKKPVSKKQLNQVIKNIALNGTKVEIYENNVLSKVFYVGNNTSNEMGTYFYMDKAKEPYICHIPGFNGFLNTRFYTDAKAWRSKTVFAATDEKIENIQVKWHQNEVQSFEIKNSKDQEPQLIVNGKALENNKVVNLNKLKSYLKLWENLAYEGFPINLNDKQIDSIYNTPPLLTLSLTAAGKTTQLKIHKKGMFEDTNIQFDRQGNPLEYDIENFYAFINNNNKEVVQIQDYVFGKVMKTNRDFLIKP